jgi:hypothetical protein
MVDIITLAHDILRKHVNLPWLMRHERRIYILCSEPLSNRHNSLSRFDLIGIIRLEMASSGQVKPDPMDNSLSLPLSLRSIEYFVSGIIIRL